MNLVYGFFRSSLGKKYIMAATGMAMFFFVIAHLLGNLQVFLGPESINSYGYFLQSKPELVWTARLGLLACVALHIWAAIKLTIENKAARPVSYGEYKPVAASFFSRTMPMSGLIIACFIVYHLLHYTALVKAVNMTGQDFHGLHDNLGRHDIYHMIIFGFRQPVVSLFYIISMGLLLMHLRHGATSMFQSLGWRKRNYINIIDRFALIASLALFLGYIAIPIGVLTNIVKERPEIREQAKK